METLVTTILTQTIARLLLLPIFVAAIALLVKGYESTGDGFSAGVIAAIGVLLQYLAFGYRDVERQLHLRFAPEVAFSGLLLALLVVFLPVARGDPILTHLPQPGAEVVHLGTLELHTAVLFDVGVFLLVFGFAVTTMHIIAMTADRGLP
jgi:multisubunit Na+/H+ antiporter MnhB subunit